MCVPKYIDIMGKNHSAQQELFLEPWRKLMYNSPPPTQITLKKNLNKLNPSWKIWTYIFRS